jgi:hypothetical protein
MQFRDDDQARISANSVIGRNGNYEFCRWT